MVLRSVVDANVALLRICSTNERTRDKIVPSDLPIEPLNVRLRLIPDAGGEGLDEVIESK